MHFLCRHKHRHALPIDLFVELKAIGRGRYNCILDRQDRFNQSGQSRRFQGVSDIRFYATDGNFGFRRQFRPEHFGKGRDLGCIAKVS